MEAAQIVLIEDNPADVYLFKFALQSAGIRCEIREFHAGVDAVRELCTGGSEQTVPDLIVMDLNTPRTDGFKVLAQLRNEPRFANVPIGVLTSSQSASDKQRVEMSGARYIEKASDLKVFCHVVSQVLSEMLFLSSGGDGMKSLYRARGFAGVES